MKILFIFRSPIYLRNYESTIRLLTQKGHQIALGFNGFKGNNELPERLAQEAPSITYIREVLPERQDNWKNLATFTRTSRDYIRYLYPRYSNANKLKARVDRRLGFLFKSVVSLLNYILPNQLALKIIESILAKVERAIPESQLICEFIETYNPDLVLITPFMDFASMQIDYLKSAKSLGIPCAVCVHSWDNLTSQGLIQLEPDRLFVWNQIQKQEAIELHNTPPEKVVVTGAQCYDKWFERHPSIPTNEFNKKVGLHENKPYILYLCSSGFIAPQEVDFVKDWLARLRKSDNYKLREIGVLIRPHPQNTAQWDTINFAQDNNVVIWPAGGANPITEESRTDFYDSMYHSIAVVGINTSAMIEAGILGKPVYTILDPRFKNTQEGTLHFHYLADGGLLQQSQNVDEHLQQLKQLVESELGDYQTRITAFIQNFVRPNGLEVACTPIIAEAIEVMPSLELASVNSNLIGTSLFRLGLQPIALLMKTLDPIYTSIVDFVSLPTYLTISSSQFLQELQSGLIQEVIVAGQRIYGTYAEKTGGFRYFVLNEPLEAQFLDELESNISGVQVKRVNFYRAKILVDNLRKRSRKQINRQLKLKYLLKKIKSTRKFIRSFIRQRIKAIHKLRKSSIGIKRIKNFNLTKLKGFVKTVILKQPVDYKGKDRV